MRAQSPSVSPSPVPPSPPQVSVFLPGDGSVPTDDRPNRAARRGKRAAVPTASSHGRGAAPHARGAQGRRIIPVRRTG